MSASLDKDEFYAELDALGEDGVRENLAAKRYGTSRNKRALAEEWLAGRERGRSDFSQSEQIDIARSAKDAAWEATKEACKSNRIAHRANIIAITALIMATIAVTCTIISLLLQFKMGQ